VKPVKPWLKQTTKRMARPAARPILDRIRVEQQLADQLAQYLPIVLNAISTQNATAREFERYRRDFEMRLAELGAAVGALGEQIAMVHGRNEFIRREVMYEARYGRRSHGVEDVEPGDFDRGKLAIEGPLRLNLGSGHVPREGFVNVDARPLDGVDVVADVRLLPFESETVDEIYSSHLVEHFPIEELRRTLLPHWFEVLAPGGRLVAVTPDAEMMIGEAAAGRMPFEDLQRVTFGDQEYDGDFHFAMFTPESFAELVTAAGFAGVEIVDRGRRNGLCYEFEVSARRPAAGKGDANGRAVPGEGE
jgi:SAM-dependent methyltransferase